MLKFTKGTVDITVMVIDGKTDKLTTRVEKVPGWIMGSLAAAPAWIQGRGRKTYRITHLPSGKCFGTAYTLKAVKDAVRALQDLTDWSVSEDEILKVIRGPKMAEMRETMQSCGCL